MTYFLSILYIMKLVYIKCPLNIKEDQCKYHDCINDDLLSYYCINHSILPKYDHLEFCKEHNQNAELCK